MFVEAPIAEEAPVVEETPAAEPVVAVAPEMTSEELKKEKKSKKEKKVKGKKPVFLIILSILMTLLFLASAGLNVYQYYQQKNNTQENEKVITELKANVSSLEKEKAKAEQALDDASDTISGLNDTIDEMTAAMNEEAVMLDAYERLTYSLKLSELGYYSDEFFSEYQFVYVAPGEEVEMMLYTLWEGSGTVDIRTDTDYATAAFMQNEWSEEVGILLTGVKEGMTVVTFTWDDEKRFDVIVFVEE